jgi:hypothetical protein
MALRRQYLAANIGDQYQRLGLGDWRGPETVRADLQHYLDKWPSVRQHGMGLELASKRLGTGKTFLACAVGKELIKQGVRVFFTPFIDVIDKLSHDTDERAPLERRLKETTVLILDEVIPPFTQAQGQLFARQLELVVRHRQNFNMPTIMTTNLEQDELAEIYPRTYSLLAAKQFRVALEGPDVRQDWIERENQELVLNDETRPIC